MQQTDFNPYKVLGVAPSADTETIKAAFRDLAKEKHPDKGGDASEFHAIRRAVTLLTDPEKRKRYDDTGEISDDDGDPVEAVALRLLAKTLQEALSDTDGDPNAIDLVDAMRNHFQGLSIELREGLQETQGLLARAERARANFVFEGKGRNIVEGMFRAHIRDLRTTVAGKQMALEGYERAIEMLAPYHFNRVAGAA